MPNPKNKSAHIKGGAEGMTLIVETPVISCGKDDTLYLTLISVHMEKWGQRLLVTELYTPKQ